MIGRTTHYHTDVIRIARGVFQGDTLSPTIFVTLFNQILLYLRTEKHHGVCIKDEQISALAFADDLTIVCNNARSAQRILNAVSSKLESNGLVIKPSKCFSLSIKSGCFDQSRKFALNGVDFENISQASMKFLGLNIYCKNQRANSAKYLQSKLSTLLNQVDRLPIRGQYKLEIYDGYVTSCLRFDLSVCEVAQSNLEALDRMVRKFLKKWCKMPQSSHTGHLYHSSGLNVDLPSHLYTAGHANVLFQPAPNDPVLQEAVATALDMSSTHPATQQAHSQVTDLVRNSRDKKALKKGARGLKDSDMEDASTKLVKQGRWAEILANLDSDLTWKASLAGLSEATYSFALKSLVDCLPTNCNLHVWKQMSEICGSCGTNRQTLLHVLNNCPVKLKLYSWRHDNILFKLKNILCSHLPSLEIHCDLFIENNVICDINICTIPIDIYLTNLRPDLVVIDRENKSVIILELTVPFETNFANAQERKCLKYSSVISGLEEAGFKCSFYSLEIGSRGIAAHGTCSTLRKICRSTKKETRDFVYSIVKVALKCSYVIFKEKDDVNASHNTLIDIM